MKTLRWTLLGVALLWAFAAYLATHGSVEPPPHRVPTPSWRLMSRYNCTVGGDCTRQLRQELDAGGGQMFEYRWSQQ